jgi:hypothetical protein
MLDKRYQVFISSTFRDLIDERQAVLKAILEMNHMPAGMELFPAVDDTAWQLIKDVIDSSDYYILLIGGRYGSLDEEGLGYTEKEYDYAIRIKKPVIPLLHKAPNILPRDKTETDPGAWQKLEEFRKKVERKHTCIYWETTEELKSKIIISLSANVKRHPAVGWVRADSVPTDATIRDVLVLRKRIAELESELKQVITEAPPGTEDLMQGDDTLKLIFTFQALQPEGNYNDLTTYRSTIKSTWDEIFAGISPVMINEASERNLQKAFLKLLEKLAMHQLNQNEELKEHRKSQFKFSDEDFQTCLVQLRALGLISESDRKRSLKDTETYWTLTPYGDRMMVQLRALRYEAPTKRLSDEKPEVLRAETK